MAKKDLTGQRFGRLTVIREHPEPYRSPAGKPTRRWVCRCDCGREVTVLQNSLTAKGGHAQSCGCLQKEKASRPKKDLTGRRFGRWTVIRRAPLPKKAATGERNGWLCRCDCGTSRVVLNRSLVDGSSRSCGCDTAEKAAQRVLEENVLGWYRGTTVSAIRPERGPNKNSTSGVKGVYWSERDGAWIAKIGFRGRTITLGRFSTIDAAKRARQEAEEKYYKPVIAEYESEEES